MFWQDVEAIHRHGRAAERLQEADDLAEAMKQAKLEGDDDAATALGAEALEAAYMAAQDAGLQQVHAEAAAGGAGAEEDDEHLKYFAKHDWVYPDGGYRCIPAGMYDPEKHVQLSMRESALWSAAMERFPNA